MALLQEAPKNIGNIAIWQQTCVLPPVPYGPSTSTLLANIDQARQYSDYVNSIWWIGQVEPGGSWDYKKKNSAWVDFGNFNYGATGTALGDDENTLLYGAGLARLGVALAASVYKFSLKPMLVAMSNVATYYDQPEDQAMIKKGIYFYDRFSTCR